MCLSSCDRQEVVPVHLDTRFLSGCRKSSFISPPSCLNAEGFTFQPQILQTVSGGSRGLGYIYAGRVIAGLGIGAISAVAPAFVSECSPKDVRGRITGLFQIMVAVGVMLSYFINRASSFCLRVSDHTEANAHGDG